MSFARYICTFYNRVTTVNVTSCEFPVLPAELLVGDQAGAIHIWDLKTDHNEQRVPDPDTSIQSIAVDAEGKTMAAINTKVGHSEFLEKNRHWHQLIFL